MKLYYAPGACSLSPHIVLREAGQAFDLVKVDLKSKKTEAGEDFTSINSKGQVPTLVIDGGDILTEGPAIVQYVADKAPASGLAPANGTMARYRLQELLNMISTELHKGFSPLWNPKAPEETKKAALDALMTRYERLDAHLSKNDYLMGDVFTAADAYLYTVTNWFSFLKIDISRFANIASYMARIAARPKVQEALKAEGLMR